jgi:signal transduction histidine kinase
MNDYYAVPTMVLLAVVTAVFYTLWRRVRTTTSLLWTLAWVLMLVRLAFESAYPRGGVIAELCSDCALQLSGLLFVSSLAPESFGRRRKVLYVVAYAIPLLIYTVSTHFVMPSPVGKVWMTLLFLTAATIAWLWSWNSHGLPRWVMPTALVALSPLVIRMLLRGNFDSPLNLALFYSLILTALLFAFHYRRFTPGCILTVIGFLAWANIFTAFILMGETERAAENLTRISDLIKIVTALGMLILLLEEEVRINTRAKERESRIRGELERYTGLYVASAPGAPAQTLYDRACSTVTAASLFREAILILRGSRQEWAAVASSVNGCIATPPAAVASLLSRLEDVTAQSFGLRATPLTLRTVCLTSTDSEMEGAPAEIPPGLPESSWCVVLLTQTGVRQGWLWLAHPRIPNLTSDDLLPIEALSSRLSIALENRDLTQLLIRTDRLAGLGKLAGGVAHELNNPLTIVQGYAELIKETSAEERIRKQSAVILSESQRMKRIIEDMARFWRPPSAGQGIFDMRDVVRDVAAMHEHELHHHEISLDIRCPAEPLPVMGTRDALRQVFLKVVHNAIEAIERDPRRGERRISIDLVRMDGAAQAMITDTGPGFDDPERVFDPFYTTKDPGDGPGLGLSVCYGLVREHNGEITAFNLSSSGAAVVIELPLDESALLQMEQAAQAAAL